jgi:hypothetical protein
MSAAKGIDTQGKDRVGHLHKDLPRALLRTFHAGRRTLLEQHELHPDGTAGLHREGTSTGFHLLGKTLQEPNASHGKWPEVSRTYLPHPHLAY